MREGSVKQMRMEMSVESWGFEGFGFRKEPQPLPEAMPEGGEREREPEIHWLLISSHILSGH